MSQLSHSSCIRSVLLDHKLEVDGIIFHEHKELETTINEEGNKESVLSHTRAIGDRVYKAQQRVIDGEVREETCETQMAPEEIEDFKNEWDEKWQPSIVEKSTGIMRTFFKKLAKPKWRKLKISGMNGMKPSIEIIIDFDGEILVLLF